MMTYAVAPGLATVATFASTFRKAAGVRKGGSARILVYLMVRLAGSIKDNFVAVEIVQIGSNAGSYSIGSTERHVKMKTMLQKQHSTKLKSAVESILNS